MTTASYYRVLLQIIMCTLIPAALPAEDTIVISTGTKGDVIIQLTKPIIREAYKRLNIPIKIVNYPWNRSLAYSNNGTTDAELFRIEAIQAAYPNLHRVDEVLTDIEFVVFSKNVSFEVTDWESLRPYIITYISGVEFIRMNTTGMKVMEVGTAEHAFRLLEAGRTEIVIESYLTGLQVISRLGYKDIRILSPALNRIPVYHYLNSNHVHHIPMLKKMIKEIKNEGLIRKERNDIEQQLLFKNTVIKDLP